MVEKFTVPKTKKEFLERADPVTKLGAKGVIQGLKARLKKVAGPLEAEIKFFEEALEYKQSGTIPERFNNE